MDGGKGQILIVPLRVNVNIKSKVWLTRSARLHLLDCSRNQMKNCLLTYHSRTSTQTMEELEGTRKTVLLSAISDMHAESQQEIQQLVQAKGEIRALNDGQETEWFNDTSHRENSDSSFSSQQYKDSILKRRRKDLLEL
jgi:hypothetical protein